MATEFLQNYYKRINNKSDSSNLNRINRHPDKSPGDILNPTAIEDGKIEVDIKSVTANDRKQHIYTCKYCNGRMTPVFGKRRKHFRHIGKHCCYDNSLHGYAEFSFIKEYQRCLDEGLPFYLEMPVEIWCNKSCVLNEHSGCKERFVKRRFNLTKLYTRIKREVKVQTDDNKYRKPDILLESENGDSSLWIEFFVSHEVDEIKSKEGSIVEIKIDSKEQINKILSSHTISTYGNKEDAVVKLYNIPVDPIDAKMDKTPPCELFFVYQYPYDCSAGYRIISRIPSGISDFTQFRIILKLNWFDHYYKDGHSTNYYNISQIRDWCFNRFFHNARTESPLSRLIVKEERKYIKPIIFPSNKPSKQSISPYCSNKEKNHESRITTKVEWINLNLPSGTLWADCDTTEEPNSVPDGFFAQLPSRKDINEIKAYCKQLPIDNRLKVIGQNSESITLNADKYRLSERGSDFIYCMNIYALVDKDYIHIIEEDFNRCRLKRYVCKPLTND